MGPLGADGGGGLQAGFSWWQAAGGALVVFALLVIFLRLLARLHAPQRHAQAALLAVWPLGPRREIEVVKLRDEVHYVYRHDAGLAVLRSEPAAAWEAAGAGAGRGGAPGAPGAPNGGGGAFGSWGTLLRTILGSGRLSRRS